MLFSLLKHCLELFITDTVLKVFRSFTVSPLVYLMVLKTFSPGCGVWASLMLLFCLVHLESVFRWRLSVIKILLELETTELASIRHSIYLFTVFFIFLLLQLVTRQVWGWLPYLDLELPL